MIGAPAENPGLSGEIFQAMLDFDSRGELLDFRFSCQGMLMWPFVRWRLLSATLAAATGAQPHSAPVRLSAPEKVRYAWLAWRHRPWRALRGYDIVWFGSAGGVTSRKDGKWFGRVNDYLVDLARGRTLLIEDSHGAPFKLPRHAADLRFHDLLRIRAAARARLNGGAPASDRRRIAEFRDFLRRGYALPLPEGTFGGIESDLLRIAARLPAYHAAYTEIFSLTRPKVVFMEDGCYGHHSYIIKWAKEMGIRTAEFQHGAIVPSHHAYNYGSVGFHPDYAAHLPDYLLTHGPFWSANTRLPSRKVVIGSPHFQANLDAGRSHSAARKPSGLLIVSQGDVTGHLVSLARSLSRLAPGLSITFRLHPAEAAFTERYSELRGLPNVTVSATGDIYDLLLGSEWVVGVSSTTIYEAAGLDRPVFILDIPNSRLSTPRNYGTWFKDAGELASLLGNTGAGAGSPREEVWASDWAGNYLEFLRREIGIRPET